MYALDTILELAYVSPCQRQTRSFLKMFCSDCKQGKAFLNQTIPLKMGKSQTPGLEQPVVSVA